MKVDQLLTALTDGISVRRVFGEPVTTADGLVIPVAWVLGGGGGGGGGDGGAEDEGGGLSGSGGGTGFVAGPVGMYRVTAGAVTWHPAVHVTAIAITGQVLLAVVLRAALRRRRR